MDRKTVLITGSSRGIGKAIAMKFAHMSYTGGMNNEDKTDDRYNPESNGNIASTGYNIIINCAHSKDELLRTKTEIEACGVACLSFLGDMGNYNTVRELYKQIEKQFGSIDILINNAGISYIGLLTDMTPDEWNRVINTNLTSVYNCCSLAIPYMLKKKSGRIINISSVWGNVGASCEVAYSASKGGMNALTKALARELAPSNIQVNAIACGAIDTEMNPFLSEEDRLSLINEIPANRLGRAEEVAELAYQLANAGAYLTGQIIGLDGGWM